MVGWFGRSGGLVYDETITRELKIKPISECRCNERLKSTDATTPEP